MTSNGPRHICVKYDGPPCVECGAPTVFVFIGAPGVGSGNQCQNGHYDGDCRELTLREVM